MVVSRSVGLLSILVYLSFTGVFLGSAVSLTDPTLALCVSAAYGATFFAIFLEDSGPRREWWFRLAFAALGLGFLVKGPVAVVLFGVGIGLWLLGSRRWSLVREVPWRSGLAIWGVCWLPWYVTAEIATPGFLRYFFLQENLLRFVSSSESGLRYGTLHTHSRGMIWVMLFGVAFPWSLIGIGRLWSRERAARACEVVKRDPRVLFLLCWGVSSPLFFTAARQVLPTYTYSSLPPLAVLMALGLAAVIDSRESRQRRSPGIARVAGLLGTICLLGGVWGLFEGVLWQAGNKSLGLFAVILGMFVVLAANRYRHSSATVVVPLAIFGLIAAYGGVLAGVAGMVSEHRSTAAIIEAARLDDEQRSEAKPLAVLFSAPHSILFYGAGGDDEHRKRSALPVISMGLNLSQAMAAGATRFIVKETDLSRISAEERSRLIKQATRGQWHLFGLAAG
jgi:4-amino-4-deoxy-L-arabinose transferase-like glycosyltransferase